VSARLLMFVVKGWRLILYQNETGKNLSFWFGIMNSHKKGFFND
jgi:hypothetical protein